TPPGVGAVNLVGLLIALFPVPAGLGRHVLGALFFALPRFPWPARKTRWAWLLRRFAPDLRAAQSCGGWGMITAKAPVQAPAFFLPKGWRQAKPTNRRASYGSPLHHRRRGRIPDH